MCWHGAEDGLDILSMNSHEPAADLDRAQLTVCNQAANESLRDVELSGDVGNRQKLRSMHIVS